MKEIYVAAGMLWRSGRVLCCRRPEHGPMGGWWEFPGGKLEPGETAEQALVRELEEELGTTVKRPRLWRALTHEYTEKALTVHLSFFTVTEFDPMPAPREGQQLAWSTPEEACRLPFLPADAELVRDLEIPSD